jgi:hypothetical protein
MAIPSWLDAVAPTIATALGGPLAGLAVEAVSKAMGVKPQEVQSVIAQGKMSADQIAALRQAELQLQTQAQEMGLDFAKVAAADRASARSMQAQVKSWVPGTLALLVTFGFFGILIGLMLHGLKPNPELDIMLGSLGTAWVSIIAFYFGSSKDSQNKTLMMHEASMKSTP